MKNAVAFILVLLAGLTAECLPLCFLLVLAAGVCVGVQAKEYRSQCCEHQERQGRVDRT